MDTVSVGRGYLRVLVIVYPQISTIDADMNQKKICGICGLSLVFAARAGEGIVGMAAGLRELQPQTDVHAQKIGSDGIK